MFVLFHVVIGSAGCFVRRGVAGVCSGVKPGAVLGLDPGGGWLGWTWGEVAPSHRLEEGPQAQGCPGLPHPSVQRVVEG